MNPPESQSGDKESRDKESKPPDVEIRPLETRPDKNVVVPKFDILTEGIDLTKLKNKSSI
jgi:hypothetical protein